MAPEPHIRQRVTRAERRGLWALFGLALGCFILYNVAFFMALASLVSDASWGDVSYHHQLFHNFLHGRALQTSIYWQALVNSVNPYAYLNAVNVHLCLSPYLFSFIYWAIPNLYGLYFMMILVNYAALTFFLWKLVCVFTEEDRLWKYLFVMSFVFGSAFTFKLVIEKASPIMLGTPFLLAAYYFLQRERYTVFLLNAALFCLCYDDCGLVFPCFAVYAYFFERKHFRPAISAAALGLLSTGLVIGLLQPIARTNLPGRSVASTFDALGVAWYSLNHGYLRAFVVNNGKVFLVFCSIFMALPTLWLWSGRIGPDRRDWQSAVGLIFLAPLVHWGSIVVNFGVHFMPVVVFTFIALTRVISRTPFPVPIRWSRRNWLAIALMGVYLGGNALVFVWSQRHSFSRELTAERAANARVLAEVRRSVPAGAGLTYWTSRGLDGFLADRTDVWRFPHFFDRADYLVMQKGAAETFFVADVPSGASVLEALRHGTDHSSGEKAFIDPRTVDAVRDLLVDRDQSHAVVLDDPGLLILQRKERFMFEQPPETHGFGFLRNLPMWWARRSGAG